MATEAELSYRRRLLTTAMPDNTADETIQKSLAILDDEFSGVEKIKYSQVVARLEKNLDRAEVNLSRLLARIMKLKGSSADDLMPDPKTGDYVVETREPRTVVFNALFGAVSNEVKRRGSLADLRSHFAKQVFTLGLSETCVKGVTAWAKNQEGAEIEGPDSDLQKVVNICFVWMCNKFGPVEADKVLVSCVRHAESLPEAFDCSPRIFL